MIRHVSPVLSIDALSCREATTIKNRYQDDFSLSVVPIDFSPLHLRGGKVVQIKKPMTAFWVSIYRKPNPNTRKINKK